MSTLLDTARRFFESEDWPVQDSPDPSAIRMEFQGDHARWVCYLQANEDTQQVLFYSVCPLVCPTASLPAVAEYLCRANYGMILGNFELDFNDGEIRFKTSADVEGQALSEALLRNLAYTSCLMMDRYLPGLVNVLAGRSAPLDAVTQTEAEAAGDAAGLS